MLIIGSQALRFHIPLDREPKDYDIICTHDEFQNWIKKIKSDQCYPINNGKKIIVKYGSSIYEFEIAWEGTTARELWGRIARYNQYVPGLGWGCTIVDLDVLYTLKMSHRYKKNSPHFLKTMRDIQLMRKYGAQIPEFLKEWLVKREKETYNYPHPNLNQSKGSFFDPNQGINYVYDHDSIHEAMKHLDKPAYAFFKEDTKEVKCSQSKFNDCSFGVQLCSVLEESYVLALERSQIPFKGQIEPKKSFLIALEKVCTSISSGWWREFAWENYDRVLKIYNDRYVEKFWNAVEKGEVKPYDGKRY